MENDADELQLCAQAICLEKMLLCGIAEGFLNYDEIRRRVSVSFTPALREKVSSVTEEMHQYYDRRYTPKAKRTPMCKSCSLLDLCLPELERTGSAEAYIRRALGEDEP